MVEEKKKEELNYQFVSLVFSLQQAAMAQLGKIANPATGKMEKNLIQAKATIDMIEMLKEKSKGNLTETEQKIILNTLDNLYLNYADEVATAEAAKETAKLAEKKEEKPTAAEAQKEKPTEKKEEKPAVAEAQKETAEAQKKKPAVAEAQKETTEGARRNGESEKRGNGDTEKEKPTEGTEKKPATAETAKETAKPAEEKEEKEKGGEKK